MLSRLLFLPPSQQHTPVFPVVEDCGGECSLRWCAARRLVELPASVTRACLSVAAETVLELENGMTHAGLAPVQAFLRREVHALLTERSAPERSVPSPSPSPSPSLSLSRCDSPLSDDARGLSRARSACMPFFQLRVRVTRWWSVVLQLPTAAPTQIRVP
jgi:hypothetical protein